MSEAMRRSPPGRLSIRDVIAGLSVTLVLIPQAMAYAELAGMPPQHGLYAAAAAPMAAALFASSPYLQTGPVALTALLTFGALVPLATPGSAGYVALAALLALVVGVIRCAVGILRLGWVSYLMSRPMLRGFMSGAAVLIVLSQLPAALGMGHLEGGVVARAWAAAANPGGWDGQALVLAAGTVLLVRGAPRVHPLVPGVLLAALGGVAFSALTGYAGDVVGPIPAGLPAPRLDLPWGRLPTLVVPGLVIALVGFAEAASIARTYAAEERMRWDADREFLSQGAANLAGGLVGGFPVGGSFARSGLMRLAGARSRWSGFVAGAGVLLFLPFVGVLSALPRAVLAGIVMAAVIPLFRPRELLEIGRISRGQAVVAWGTFALTVLLAPHVEQAVIVGILMAGAVHLWRELEVQVDCRKEGDLLVVEPTGVLWFGSAPALEDALLQAVADAPEVREVRLRLGRLGRIDLTGAYALREVLDQLGAAGVDVRVEDVPEHARRVLDPLAIGTNGAPDS